MLGFDLDLGIMFKIMGILLVLIMGGYAIYLFKNREYIVKEFKEAQEDMWSSILHERELPVKDRIEFVKNKDILLYDIDLKDVDKKNPKELPYEYHKMCEIVNKHIETKPTRDEEGMLNIDIELVDFREKEYENQYLEIIDLVTNFNLAQFIFKGNDTFKLVTLGDDKIESIKKHADYMISKMFAEVIRHYCEETKEEYKEIYENAYKQAMFN